MDKSRVGASRFSPAKRQIIKQSGLDGGDGNGVVAEKSKKERVRKFAIVGRVSSSHEDREMGCVGSDEEDELRPTTSISRRFKLPKKFSDDCNTADHASVPRKLRSAMKKRSHESMSPPLPDPRKPNHDGVESLRKNGLKKCKLKVQQGDSEGSPGQANVGPITKDEEEVVETLFALAGMFPGTDKSDKTKLDAKLTEAKSSTLPELESSIHVSEVPNKEEDSETIRPTATAEAANQSTDLEGSAGETVKAQSLNEASRHDLPNKKQFPIELENNVPEVNPSTMSSFSKPEPTDERLKQSMNDGTPASGKKPEIALEPVASFKNQHELQPTINQSKNKGSTLWPGLSSKGSLGAETRGPSLQSSAANLPAWLVSNTSATRPCSSENVVLTEKKSRVPVDIKKSWKRCSAHVYISRLIKVLQITERNDLLPVEPTQLTTDEGTKRGALLAANNPHGMMNGLNGDVSVKSLSCPVAETSPKEVRNAILLHKRLLQDQQQASTKSGPHTSHKPSFDFFSVMGGGCGVEANSGANRAGNGLESSKQFQVPYLHSLAQNHTIMPLSLPQNRYSSNSFPDHLSAAAAQQVQIQLPPYLCDPFSGPSHLATTVLPKQHHQQQQQQQQQQQPPRLWTAQLATQYRPGEAAATHLPNWQSERQFSPSLMRYAQAILPPSGSSIEVVGPKFTPITSLLPPTRVKRQHHHIPSGYEGNRDFFNPETASPLQLLCNEHI